MATSNKAQDPAAAALSAIEEALNLSDSAPAAEENRAPEISTPIFPKASDPDKTLKIRKRYPEGPSLGAPVTGSAAVDLDRAQPRLPEVEDHPLFTPRRNDAIVEPAPADFNANRPNLQPSATPANDDRHSVGAILKALDRRPSAAPLIIAGIVSIIWLALAGVFYAAHRTDYFAHGLSVSRPETLIFALLAVGPVIFFMVTGFLARRAQEMRLTARSMAEIAVRLSAPETIASDQMVTLSQAIRREIVSMGDGIERALARAGELETLVRSEVSNLERSYSENERRIRSLVDELQTERESMLANSERMRSAVGGAQDSFAQELDTAAVRLSENLNNAGNRITTTLGSTAEEIRFSIARVGEDLLGTLATHGEQIIGRLEQTRASVDETLSRANGALAETFNQRLGDVDAHLQETSEAFANHIVQRLDDAGGRVATLLGGTTSSFEEITQSFSQRLEDVDAHLRTTGEAVVSNIVRELDEAAERAATALGGTTSAFDDISQGLSQKLADANVQLRDGSETAVNEITQKLEEASARIAAVFEDSSSSFAEHSDKMHERIATTAQDSFDHFAYHAGTLHDRFAETASDAISAIATHSERVNETLAERLARFEDTIATHGNEIADRLGENADALGGRLSTHFETLQGVLDSQGGDLDRKLAEHTDRTAEVFALHAQTLDDRTAARVQQVAESLDGLFGRVDNALDGRARSLHETLAARTLEIARVLSDGNRDITEALDARAEAINAEMAHHVTAFTESFAEKAGEASHLLSESTAGLGESLVARAEAINAEMAHHVTAFNDNFAEKAGEASHLLNESTAGIGDMLVARAEAINAEMAHHVTAFNDNFAEKAGAASQLLNDSTAGIGDMLAARAEAINAEMTHHLTAFTESFTQQAGDASRLLSDSTAGIGDTLAARVEEISSLLGGQASDISSALDARAGEINSTLGGRATEIALLLSVKADEVDQLLGARATEIAQTLAVKADEVNHLLGGRANEIAQTLSDQAQDVNEVLGVRASEIADTLDGRIARFEEQIVGRLDNVTADLDQRGRELSENLGQRAREIDQTLAHHTGNISAALDHESGQLEGLLSGRADALRTLLNQAGQDLDTTLAGRIGEIGSVLAGRVNEIGATLAGRLSELQTSLDERSGHLHATLSERSQAIDAVLDTKGGDLVDKLGQKQAELAAALDQSTQSLNDALAAGAAASVNSLVATHHQVRGGLGEALGALDEKNSAVQRTVESAQAAFSAIESGLASRIADFEHATYDINRRIDMLGDNASSTVASAQALFETIAHQQEALTAAAVDLAHSQAELDQSLKERRTALENLLGNIQARRDEIDAVTTSFTNLVEEAFHRAETRAHEIGTFLADTSQTTADQAERQFGDIRNSISSERDRTVDLLRTAYEQASGEIEDIFGQSTARFQAAATEMRGMAREIQRELESTREELRRNTVSLPQETAEQTAAMRRVVADQIKALNELTDIVARSGHGYDLSDPLASSGRDIAPARRNEPARSETPRFSEPRSEASRFSEPARPETPRFSEPARESRPEPLRPARPAVATPRQTPPGADRGPGWLSDLLARASRDEQQPRRPATQEEGPRMLPPIGRSPAASEPLETISHDIARMVDHAAIADAWDRYRGGESGAFSRGLYIGRGAQTFEEIRRRYRNDADFRVTVDRYIQEFERLLADVGRDDRDDSLTRTYLTSETGKVYTMLAHAAGRLS